MWVSIGGDIYSSNSGHVDSIKIDLDEGQQEEDWPIAGYESVGRESSSWAKCSYGKQIHGIKEEG